jgi:diguanylate cyclase
MSPSTAPATSPEPDRLFARVTTILLVVGLLLATGAHLVLQRALSNERQANEIALDSAGEAAAARAALATLDRLAAMPEGRERHRALNRLAWDLDRLAAADERRVATVPAEGQVGDGLADAIGRATEAGLVLTRSSEVDLERVQSLRQVFEDQIVPQLDLVAMGHRALAQLSRARCAWVLGISFALHLVIGCSLLAFVVTPTRRSIAGWVARTKETDRENRFRLLHDSLTGMPNAAYLHAYLARLVAASERREAQIAVLRIDFDRFKVLSENHGSRTCDEVIRIAARRLGQTMRSCDFAAYLGQDDFVVVTGELEDANDVAAIATRIQAALARPFSVRGGARRLTCSIGVTLMSDDDADPDQILANAGIALAEAQSEGVGAIRYFNEAQREEVERREELYAELLHALDNGEIIAFFQPQVDLATGAFTGFEALARWQHPRRGLLSPAAFLDFAEQTDLTERLGEIVLYRSLEALKAWDQAGLNVDRVGVNFALAQLRNPTLIEKIKWEVERFDVEPSRLAIEVLETVLIKSDADIVVRNLRGLASAGFVIELDDFGTGHASISNLRRFMVNRIKIDRSFIFGIETSGEQQQLTGSMIAMARALGIETLAEGVETEVALHAVQALGCGSAQGYLIARPMALADTFDWIRTYRPIGGREGETGPAAAANPNTP